MRARDAIVAIANDMDLDGDAKLFALCMVAHLYADRQERTRTGKHWAKVVGGMMIGDVDRYRINGMDSGAFKVKRVIAHDIPRYEVPYKHTVCPVPKTRGPNVGKPCGRNPQRSWLEKNPETGEGAHVGYCSKHITRAHHDHHLALWQRWEANGKPEPPANRGGILPRHFKANWTELYAWADPHRIPLPDGKPLTPPRPQFTLIIGGNESGGPSATGAPTSI